MNVFNCINCKLLFTRAGVVVPVLQEQAECGRFPVPGA